MRSRKKKKKGEREATEGERKTVQRNIPTEFWAGSSDVAGAAPRGQEEGGGCTKAAQGTVSAAPAVESPGSGSCGHATVRREAEVRGWCWRAPKQRCPAGPGRARPRPSVPRSEGADGDRAGKQGRRRAGNGASLLLVSAEGSQAPGLPSRSRHARAKTARSPRHECPCTPSIRSPAARTGPVDKASTKGHPCGCPVSRGSGCTLRLGPGALGDVGWPRPVPSHPEVGSQPPRGSGTPRGISCGTGGRPRCPS